MRLPARLGLLLLLCALPGVTWGEPSIEEQVREQMRIAVEHSRAARYAEAFGAFDRGLEIAERHGEQGLAARVLRERGIAYIHQASYEDARADLERSAEIYESLGDVSRASKARLHIISMRGYNEPEWGLAELRKIEERLEKIDDAKTLREVQLFRARLLLGRGDHEEALAILAPLREHYAATPARLGDVLNLEAYALQQLGRFEESRTAYLDLISAAFENGNQRQIAYAYCNLGDVERELGVPVAAEASLDRAIETLDRLRSQIPGGVEERMTYLDAQVSAYDGKILLLVDERRDPIGALEVAERFHAKSLLEELHAPSRSSSSGELGKEERAVLAALIELQQKLIRTGLNDEEENELRELEGRWDRAARDRRRDTAQKIAEVTPRSPADVQAQLPDGTAMLAYWIHAERSLLWVLRRDRIELIQVPVGREELREKIARYLEPIRDRVRADDLAVRGDERAHLDLGAELYRLLIEPARSLLAGVDSLIVVPDDHLWHLPFEALVLETGEAKREKDEPWFAGYARARFLIEDFRLHYAHSASVWAELRERDPAGRGLIAIAPSLDGSAVARDRGWSLTPLPMAPDEASRVAASIDPGRALLGTDATEQEVKESLAGYRYVHFATHGYLHRERPQLSGLFLWPTEPSADAAEDGLLQGFEVGELELEAEMVSLAACNSGLGQLSRAEGIVGMARAFLVAGSRNALVSLWPVDDRASGSLVERFYSEVDESSLPAALREAKLMMLDETALDTVVASEETISYAHPYFWAAYVLIGGAP